MTTQPGIGTAKVDGRVLWWDQARGKLGSQGVRYAVVKAIPSRGGDGQVEHTDAFGKFVFERLPYGTWTFVPLHEHGRLFGQNRDSRTVAVKGDQELNLSLLELGKIDNDLGVRHFRHLMYVLLGVVIIYLILHALWPAQIRPASINLAALVAQAKEQVDTGQALNTHAELTASLAEIRRLATILASDSQYGLTAGDRQEVARLLTQIESAVAQDTRAAAQLGLLRLQYLLRFLGTPGYYWTGEPGRYIEVLLWALAGVVVSQLVDTSTYLRRGTYLRDAQMQRYALLVAGPLMTLVLIHFLSLAALELTLDNGGFVRLDLSDPRVLVAVAFIIGLSFWRSWDRLQQLSQGLLGSEPRTTADLDS